MAIKSTIYKAELGISDFDRHYYDTHRLTIACHPSENETRLMVRLLVFALHAHERLAFGKGVSDMEEPDLWLKELTGDISLWVELGHPDERVIARALGRSREVAVYAYQTSPERWWDPIKARFAREQRLRVVHLDPDEVARLASLAERSMDLTVTMQDGEIWFRAADGREAHLQPRLLHP